MFHCKLSTGHAEGGGRLFGIWLLPGRNSSSIKGEVPFLRSPEPLGTSADIRLFSAALGGFGWRGFRLHPNEKGPGLHDGARS